jgi:transcriptional regulator with XRE-family HTH domain
MIKNLKQEIKDRMNKMQISVTSLENEAKLKKSAVSNIINDRSKKPNYKTIEAIAKILCCTAIDLIGIKEEEYNKYIMRSPKKQPDVNAQIIWNPKLFNKAVSIFINYCEHNNKLPRNLSIASTLINEIYALTIHKQSDHIDEEFVDFVIKRSL